MEVMDRTILIVEDDEGLQSQLKWHFDDFSTTIVTAKNVTEAITAIRHYQPQVIIQDLGLPPDDEGVSEGFRCISETLNLAPNTKIIVLTGKNDHSNALKSIELGAYDFYFKPVETDTLDHVVAQAFKISELETENNIVPVTSQPLPGVVTANTKMLNICRMVEKIAKTNITATFIGESGTGKEVLVRAIHKLSDQASMPFVAINCAAVPENLMESELFGHEKGAFTGANASNIGKVEQANGGTLFLDEIGDMPLSLQAKLLRFLQQRTIERVGGRKEIALDLRVVCATNKNLADMVKEGSFREDLFYRICEIVVDVPALKDRGSDSVLVAHHLLELHAPDSSRKMSLSKDAIQAIQDYHWPGNIREVENRIKRAIVMSDSPIIQKDDLDLDLSGLEDTPVHAVLNLKTARMNAEIETIHSALAISKNNISAAAKLLGVTRPTLYDMMKKYKLSSDAT